MVKKILFVCTGNTCRSSMAEAIARDLSPKLVGHAEVEYSSAGVAAYPGMEASTHAIQVLSEKGIDLSMHRSRLVTRELLLETDLILAMTKRHVDYINTLLPEVTHKTFLLSEFAHPGTAAPDITDPFGGSKSVYQQTAQQLEQVIRQTIVKLQAEDFFST